MEPKNPSHIWILMARKLSGEASSDELNELDQLLREDQHANYSKEMLHDLWESGPVIDSQYTENKYKELVLQIQNMGIDEGKFTHDEHYISSDQDHQSSNKKKWIIATPSFAALVIIAAAIFFYTKPELPSATIAAVHSKNNISTKPGSKTQVTLPDGTLVILNSDSKLTYPDNFLGVTRDVTLEGEAFFEVTENKAKPFIIHSKAMDIKVLGTIFNVKAYPNETVSEASLIKGSIEVTLKSGRTDKIMLKPSEKIIVSSVDLKGQDSKKAAVKKTGENLPLVSLNRINYDKVDSLVNEIAWVQNRLVFNNESLGNIIVLLERWYGKKIVIKTPSHKELRFTGKFNNETIDQVLKALQLSHKFSYKRENGVIIIS